MDIKGVHQRRFKLSVLACTVLILAPRPAAAECTLPTPMSHGPGSYFLCGAPASAYAFELNQPAAVNTDGLPLACDAPDPVRCSNPASGATGDGLITIESDWSATGVNGCPVGPNGPQRIVLVASDELSGTALLVSLSGTSPSFGYAVQLAQPYDGVALHPAECARSISLVGVSGRQMTLQLTRPPVYTDCDPGSLAAALAEQGPDCGAGFRPDVQFGPLYTLVQPCTDPVDFRKSGWESTGGLPDAEGRATLYLNWAPGQCRYTGGTTLLNGAEDELVTGVVAGDVGCVPTGQEICNGFDDDCDGVADNSLNPGQVLCDGIVDAQFAPNSSIGKGSKILTWTTNSEKSLVGFNIVVIGPPGVVRVNDVPIPCEGGSDFQSHTYATFLPKHKSANRLFIEILLKDGHRALWGPVRNPILPP